MNQFILGFITFIILTSPISLLCMRAFFAARKIAYAYRTNTRATANIKIPLINLTIILKHHREEDNDGYRFSLTTQ